MNALLNIDHPWHGFISPKTIRFTSSTYGFIRNIPNLVLGILLLPIVVFVLLPILVFSLNRMLYFLRKNKERITKSYSNFTYEEAKKEYEILSSILEKFSNGSTHPELSSSKNIFIRTIDKKIYEVHRILSEIKLAVEQTIYVYSDQSPRLTEEEKEGLKSLNEIWGDDDDETYAKFTHHHLTKK